MIAALALAVALGAGPADVGVVFRSDARATALIQACPHVAVVDTSSGGADLLRTFFAACPTGTAVLQLPPPAFTPTAGTASDATLAAAQYWSHVAPFLNAPLQLAPGSLAATWLAGPLDFDTFPSWRSDPRCDGSTLFCAADFTGAFWAELDRLARADGFRGVMLPPFAPRPGDRADALCRVLAGADFAGGRDLAWTWDGVSPAMSTSPADELTTTFGFRDLRSACLAARAHPLLVRVSVAGGWQARSTVSDFMTWVRWLDGAVDLDPAPFLGVALFAFGSGDLNDLEPAASELAAFLVDPGSPAGGGSGGSNGGVGPPPPPPTQPGSSLGGDGGRSGGGCSSAGGSPGAVAFIAVALASLRRRSGVTRA